MFSTLDLNKKMSQPWEDHQLGWIPNAKRKTGVFYNDLMPKFYKSYWPVYPDKKQFRKAFIAERTRQWGIKEKMTDMSKLIEFVTSDNDASVAK